ncbi:MAG: hypothetical protein NC429_05105, partial [Lachnospiraceae bacterium]|nr:hypothetical protein [Lachnospiraceae bacterium]
EDAKSNWQPDYGERIYCFDCVRLCMVSDKLPLITTQRFTASAVNHSTVAEALIGKDTLVTDSLYGDLFLKEPFRERERGDAEINLHTSVRSLPPPLPH